MCFPWRRVVTRLALRRMPRCCDIMDCSTFNRSHNSYTEKLPPLSRLLIISCRVGLCIDLIIKQAWWIFCRFCVITSLLLVGADKVDVVYMGVILIYTQHYNYKACVAKTKNIIYQEIYVFLMALILMKPLSILCLRLIFMV